MVCQGTHWWPFSCCCRRSILGPFDACSRACGQVTPGHLVCHTLPSCLLKLGFSAAHAVQRSWGVWIQVQNILRQPCPKQVSFRYQLQEETKCFLPGKEGSRAAASVASSSYSNCWLLKCWASKETGGLWSTINIKAGIHSCLLLFWAFSI